MNKITFTLVQAVLFLFFSLGLFASEVTPGNPSMVEQLNSIAVQWRAKFKSNNVGCFTPGLGPNEANDAESDVIDKIKSLMPSIWNSRPLERDKRGYDRHNRHHRVMDYADAVDASALTIPASSSTKPKKQYVGNCGEIGPHLYAHLFRTYKDVSIALVQEIGFFADHGYVLVNCSDDIYIVDGWRGQAVGPMTFDSTGVFLRDANGNPHPDYKRGVQPLSAADPVKPGGKGAVWYQAKGTQSF